MKDKITDMKLFQHKKEVETEEKTGKPSDMSKRIIRHKVLILYKIAAVAAVIILLASIIYVNWKNKTYTDYDIQSSVAWTNAQNAICMPLGGTILSYSKDGMSCTDAKGKALWNITYEMQNPIVRTSGNVAAVGDYNGRTIYVCDETKSLGQIDTTIPIRDFCVSDTGVVAAVLDDSDVTVIYLYDVSGKELVRFKTSISKSGYPLAVGISGDSKQVVVSYLRAENGAVSSNVAFYNFSAVGQNYTDNLVGGYGYADAVVPYVAFMSTDTVFAVADDRLMIYQGSEIPKNTADVVLTEQIQSVFHNEQNIGLVYYNPSGNTKYRMDIYDTTGKKTEVLEFNTEYTDIIFDRKSIIIYNDMECQVYTLDGILKYNGTFREIVYTIVPTTSLTRYMIVTETGIQMIELK